MVWTAHHFDLPARYRSKPLDAGWYLVGRPHGRELVGLDTAAVVFKVTEIEPVGEVLAQQLAQILNERAAIQV